jgi:hypothetical protein
VSKAYPIKLAEPLRIGEEFVEVTEAGTLRRSYRAWGDYTKELAAWKAVADRRTGGMPPKRTFRLCCVFLDDAEIEFPEIEGADGKPLRGVYSTPMDFREKMLVTAQGYSDFTYAFTQGELKCEWVFENLKGLKWTQPGKKGSWGCQPKAVAEQVEPMLAKYKDANIDMWVFCAGTPTTLNGKSAEEMAKLPPPTGKAKPNAKPGARPKPQRIGPPPYGISYTQWQLLSGYCIATCAPHLGVIVHEVNHRYLDNLRDIEGMQLTQFHGLAAMGFEFGDLGFDENDLATYRAVYLYVIRPAMWRRFSLVKADTPEREAFSGQLYDWEEVRDDCWFKLPLLSQENLATLTGLPSLRFAPPSRKERYRHFTVASEDRSKILSPYVAEATSDDRRLNNLLSVMTESAAVLRTQSGHWLIVRPETVDAFVRMRILRDQGPALRVAGWINEEVCPLVVLEVPESVAVPATEIEYFR